MKLVLASAGFYTDEIADKCVELVSKPKDEIKVAVINEAYAVEHGDHSWVLDDLNNIKKHFQNMDLVNLLALELDKVVERLKLSDVIFVVGGHTDYLMSVFNNTGLAKVLPDLLQDKVYVGSSAGSMVVCNRVSTEAYLRIYGEGDDYGVDRYIGLVDIAIKPHLDSPIFPNNRKNILLEASKGYEGVVYGLRDDSAVVVEGDKQYVIGSEPVKIQNDKLL